MEGAAAFTDDLAQGIREMFRQWTQNGRVMEKPGRLPPRASDNSRAPIVQTLRVTSATADAYGYPAMIQTVADDVATWEDTYGEIRAVKVGGGTLTTGLYIGRLMRVAGGYHVYGVLESTGGVGSPTFKDDKSGSVTSSTHKINNSTVYSSSGEAVTTIDDADATNRGLVSVNNQTMGDGDKTFQRAVLINSLNGVDNGLSGYKLRVNNGAGASSFRVQPSSWVIAPGLYGYRTDAYLFEDDISRTDPIYIGNLVAYGRARFLSIVGASGQVVDDPLRSEAGALGEDGIFLVNCSGRLSGKPGVVAFRLGSVNPQLSLAFDNDNAVIYPSCSAFSGNARYGIERLGGVIPGVDGTDPLGNVYNGGIITTLGTGIPYSAITGTPSLAVVATSGAYSDLIGAPSLTAVATSGDYSDLTGAPSLATVATTGDYSDLSGTPSLAAVAISGAYSDLSGAPSLATVATSGDYSDLSGSPSLAPVATSGNYSDLSGLPSLAAVATTGAYADLIGGAFNVPYAPSNSADWAGDPATVGAAIDRLAAALAGLLGGPVP